MKKIIQINDILYYIKGTQSVESVGSVITEKDIIPLRPGDGICAMNWENVIGQKVNTNLKKLTKLVFLQHRRKCISMLDILKCN